MDEKEKTLTMDEKEKTVTMDEKEKTLKDEKDKTLTKDEKDKTLTMEEKDKTLTVDEKDEKGHHVHFSEDTDAMGNTAIAIKEKIEGKEFEAHVGFLQINHRYQIDVTLPVKDADNGYQIPDAHGVYCHASSLQVTESGGLLVSLELLAHKEKLLREKIVLTKPTEGEMQLTILARVLGKGKGTPMLRDHIKCVGVEADEESEASDWQGFS